MAVLSMTAMNNPRNDMGVSRREEAGDGDGAVGVRILVRPLAA
jgi:hypothetical protein